ncbi:glycosyltransferase involved in cell wall biosynthesis [Microterricola gilva]|uniref:Glycosyltransferase involved in cell wall biosynthesis n=1 Tax=Microterricola gilva TaxID=393267 RepID=A0A4Q8AIU9_9MICO|nr:glycosyltransferase [Microterricola gilva]RZU64344.1 glycosyltransferase involved in cell wall biosynthesis [Microterricola gilva]
MVDRGAEGVGRAHGITVGAFPHYPNNPWQSLLYREVEAQGATIVTIPRLEDLLRLGETSPDWSGFVLHVNWTGAVTQIGDDVLESMRRVSAFLGVADQILAGGGHLVWTIHNVLPHEIRYLLPEIHLLSELARRASRIVIMNPATVAEISAVVDIDPATVVLIDHPSYLGHYPNEQNRTGARARFGFDEDDIVVLSLGAIRPYKNIERLAAAVGRAQRDEPRLRLLVGGELGPGADRSALEAALDAVGARYSLDYVSDAEIQHWMNAADFAVFPYTHLLNTGALMLAATFGIPAVVTSVPATEGLCMEDWVVPIPQGLGRDDIAEAMLTAVRDFGDRGHIRAAAIRFAEAHHPDVISDAFATLICQIVVGGQSGR